MADVMTLQSELKLLRKTYHLTQEQVAEKLKMKRSSYAQKELEGDFDSDELSKLTKIFNTSPQHFDQFVVESERSQDEKHRKMLTEHVFNQKVFNKVLLSVLAELLANQKGQSVIEVMESLEKKINAPNFQMVAGQ